MQALLFFIVFLVSSVPMFLTGKNENILLLIIHLLLALISSISLFSYKNRPYSLYKIIHLFFLFFICIAPICQFKCGITFWGGIGFSEYDYIYTSFIFLCIILLYNSIYNEINKHSKCILVKRIAKKLSKTVVINKPITHKEFTIFLILDIIILFSVLYINEFNLFYLFFRGGISEEDSQLFEAFKTNIPQSINLIIVNFLKPMTVVLFLSAYKLKASKIELFILAFFMLLSAFPTSMPRFSAAAMYIPILLTFFHFFKKPNIFILFFVLGLLIIFPFLNNFRYVTSNTEIEFGLNFEMFLEGHFDSYSSLMRILINDMVTYGKQLLGCFFFWVPRSIWITKPIGSGAYIADELNLSLSNISCCYFAEGYINGGFIGILLFTIFIAIYTSMFDSVYWNTNKNIRMNSFFEILYFLLLGLTFFIMRGDLLSSFAFTMGFSCSVLFVYYLLLFIRKYSIRLNKRI